VDVLGTRSGMFVKTGRICDWAHGNFREYLAGRAMDTQLLGSSDDYGKVLGERPFDSKWFEAIRTLVQVNSKSAEILKWIAGRAASRADAESALLVHYYWTQTLNQNDPETVEAVVDALMVGLADTQTGLNPPRRIKQALVEMGHPAVPALLAALSRLNNLQKELFPEWRGKNPPDVHTESGKRVYQSSRQRQAIVEVFGQINDARTFDPLVSLLDEEEFDSNRVHVRRAAQKALACIGYPVIEPLLKAIRDSHHSTETRHQALVALKLVGRRTDPVSQTLAECFREGLAGNYQLLNWTLFAATWLRDRNQSDFATETLKLNKQELVAEAADFFSAMTDAPLKDLVNSLKRWNEMETHPFARRRSVESSRRSNRSWEAIDSWTTQTHPNDLSCSVASTRTPR
jgi:HEAT repeats